jgi:hypothetical protein
MLNLDESIKRRRGVSKCHFQQGVCKARTVQGKVLQLTGQKVCYLQKVSVIKETARYMYLYTRHNE